MEDHKACQNCGHTLNNTDLFCGNCGQKQRNSRISTREFVTEGISSFFNFDNRTWRTLRDLWIPAQIPLVFFSGKRKYYSNPFRILLVTIFFLIIVSSVDRLISGLSEDQSFAEKIEGEYRIHGMLDQHTLYELDSIRIQTRDTSLQTLLLIQDYASHLTDEPKLKSEDKSSSFRLNIGTQEDIKKKVQDEDYDNNALGDSITKAVETILDSAGVNDKKQYLSKLNVDSLKRYKEIAIPFDYDYFIIGYKDSLKLRPSNYSHSKTDSKYPQDSISFIDFYFKKPSELIASNDIKSGVVKLALRNSSTFFSFDSVMLDLIKSNRTYIFISIVPLFAIFFWLFNSKKKYYFVEHLVLVAHFLSLSIVLITLLSVFTLPGYVNSIVILSLLLWLLIHMKRYFKQSYFLTFIKLIGILFTALFTYTIILLIGTVIVLTLFMAL